MPHLNDDPDGPFTANYHVNVILRITWISPIFRQ